MYEKTAIDFIIEISHNIPLRDRLLKAIKDATSPTSFRDFFNTDPECKGIYFITDDECNRLYENQERMLGNPHVEKWVKDPTVKGY